MFVEEHVTQVVADKPNPKTKAPNADIRCVCECVCMVLIEHDVIAYVCICALNDMIHI